MTEEEYRIRLIDLPCPIRSFVKMDADGFYTIILNSRLSAEMQLKAYKHEIDHIKNDDLYSPLVADQIEEDRHER